MLVVGFAGDIEDIEQCVPGGGRWGTECVDTLLQLLTTKPSRDVVRALSQILLIDPFMGMNVFTHPVVRTSAFDIPVLPALSAFALTAPALVVQVLRAHAPADPILAFASLTAALSKTVRSMPYLQIIEGITENYLRVLDRNLRDRARIALLDVADNALHPAQKAAQKALVVLWKIDAGSTTTPPSTAVDSGTPFPWGAVVLGVSMLALMGLAIAGQQRGSLI